MRRSLFGLVAASVFLAACSEQPTESPGGTEAVPSAPPAALSVATQCTLGGIVGLIRQLLPPGALRSSAEAIVNSLPANAQARIAAAVRSKIFLVTDLILKAFNSGRLNGGKSATTQDTVLALIRSLYCFVGLPQPNLPAGSLGDDGAVAVVTPTSPRTVVITPNGHAAIDIPARAAPEPTTIAISPLPDSPGPLLTSLDQFPLFREFTSSPAVTFRVEVIGELCLKNTPPLTTSLSNLRLAHNVGTSFGDVEVLPPFTGGQVLNCSTLGFGPASGAERGTFAWGLGELQSVFLPQELHATAVAVATSGVTGKLRNFSPFGIVDTASNPASLGFNSAASQSAAPGTSVAEPPSVKINSKDGAPIAKVPVLFAVASGGGKVNGNNTATVITNANGVASLTTWTLGATPGTNTVTATPPFVPRAALPELRFRPAAVFNPAFRTFTATAANPLDLTVISGNGQTGFTSQILTAPIVVQVTQDGEAVEGAPVTFQASPGSGSFPATPVPTNSDGFAESNWTLGVATGAQTATASTPGASPEPLTATATPAPPARIVLQWGGSPADLDAHLTGPVPPESRFHVFYGDPGTLIASPFAALDRDDQDSFGPETITISQQSTGTYRFSVHDYSNLSANSDAPSFALAGSGATVTLYLASGTTQVFTVPAETGGTLWTVFELSGTVITPVNTMSYTQDPFNALSFSIMRRRVQALQTDKSVIRDALAGHPK